MGVADGDALAPRLGQGLNGGVREGDEQGSVIGVFLALGLAHGEGFDVSLLGRFLIAEGAEPAQFGGSFPECFDGFAVIGAALHFDLEARPEVDKTDQLFEIQTARMVGGRRHDQGQFCSTEAAH